MFPLVQRKKAPLERAVARASVRATEESSVGEGGGARIRSVTEESSVGEVGGRASAPLNAGIRPND